MQIRCKGSGFGRPLLWGFLLLGCGAVLMAATDEPEDLTAQALQFFSGNLFPDPNFETWKSGLPAGWSTRGVACTALEDRHEGRRILEITSSPDLDGDFGFAYQVHHQWLRTGDILQAELKIKAESKGRIVLRYVLQYDVNGKKTSRMLNSEPIPLNGEWQDMGVRFAIGEAMLNYMVALYIQVRVFDVPQPIQLCAPRAWLRSVSL